MTNTCGNCPQTWTGTKAAHCATCHETFTGPSHFDRHRHDGKCLEPAGIGLVLVERAGWTAWGTEMDENWKRHLEQARAARQIP